MSDLGSEPMPGPNENVFASQRNIGFSFSMHREVVGRYSGGVVVGVGGGRGGSNGQGVCQFHIQQIVTNYT